MTQKKAFSIARGIPVFLIELDGMVQVLLK